MAPEKLKLNPRIVLAVASTLCASTMAQDTPAKPPEKPPEIPATAKPASTPGAETPAAPAEPKPAPDQKPVTDQKPADGTTPAPVPAAEAEKAKTPDKQAAPPQAEPDLMSNLASSKPSSNVTINLIKRMVKKGLLTGDEAAELIAQSEQDTIIARNQVRDDAQVATQMVIQQAVAQKVIPNLDPMLDDSVRVTYIPETVKKQIKDDLRAEIAAETKSKDTVLPKGIPDWVSRFRVKGDIRIRYEGDYFPAGNDNSGAFPDFNAINTSSTPFDVAGTVFSPQLNVDKDRTRVRIRARIGAEIDLGEGFTAGMRIGTGQDSQPVSMNQSLGKAGGGQGGNFSKYAIWLDRGYLKYEAGADPDRHFAISAGRFDNPFFCTDIIWDEDVGMDGISATGRYRIVPGITPFAAIGAYPVFNTDYNFASNNPSKFKSNDKYLYGGQIGLDLKLPEKFQLKLAGAYYYFDNVSGKLSTPFTPVNISDAGDTDSLRPTFAQTGNTYMALRNITADATNNFGTINQWQYFGLASKFRPVALTGRLDYNGFEPFQVSLIGEYIKNLGFNRTDIASKAVNNLGATSTTNPNGSYAGGDTAWYLGVRAGHPVLQKRGNWQAGVNYRYIESDSVIDAFNDSDFAQGGTNQKGYVIYCTYATSANTSLTFRWMSASEIAGPPLRSDILMIDFSGKF